MEKREWDRNGVISNILKDIKTPQMAVVRQSWKLNTITDLKSCIHNGFLQPSVKSKILPGNKIAVTAGSRGLSHYVQILSLIVSEIKTLGASPFIIPAMGSHGGATAEGQIEVLKALGVTEQSVGAPVVSSMETVKIGLTKDGKEVRIDKNAAEADGIVLFNRIKAHTAFHGRHESGLYKMMAIGLGKQNGAAICHSDGYGKMAENLQLMGDAILENSNIIAAVALVENAVDEPEVLEVIPKSEIEEKDADLLVLSKKLMPSLPFKEMDVLVIDQIGKNFSGSGQDPNITGAEITQYAKTDYPKVQKYCILDVSDKSNGNAYGAGRADYSTKRLFEKMDVEQGYPNALTCTVSTSAKIPPIMKNDKTAIQACIFTCTGIDKDKVRLIRIKNSADISEFMVSLAMKEEVESNPLLEFVSDFKEMDFDSEGNLF